MEKPPVPADETQRLRALNALKILDTPNEERFDRITRLAMRVFHVPIALVSLIDEDRQWFKSHQGLEACETGRDISFCAHAILHDVATVLPDATADRRFADNPLVTGPPFIRFYAGHPVHAGDGSRVGTLCLIDTLPRQFTKDDEQTLADLAGMVDRELALTTQATIDELTSLSNRRGFIDLAQHVLAVCRRSGQPATLISFDLDGFKAVNDSYGHAAGDHVLKGFGALLLKHFRHSDVVARLGGDEFSVLASSATPALINGVLTRLAESFAQSPLAAAYPGLSWSTGIADFARGATLSLAQLMQIADEQMYAAKELGRRQRTPPRVAAR